jgi:hypothetical protein
MFKTTLASLTLSAALATPAAAQLGQFPNAAQQGSGMYWRQVNTSRLNYAYSTGYDGMAPSWQNPNAVYYSNGLGVAPAWSTYYPGPCYNRGPVYVAPPMYGPAPYGGYNNGGWSVGVGGSVGGGYGNGGSFGGWSIGAGVGFGGSW